MFHYSFFLQFDECRQCFIHHLIHIQKFHIVYIYQVYIVYVQSFHAFIHAFCGTLAGVIPSVHSIFAVASSLIER